MTIEKTEADEPIESTTQEIPAAESPETPAAKTRQPRRAAARKRVISSLPPGELYLNRELTWLSFNRRILSEAKDARVPLLERVKFLAIVSSNLDEFFMKRIGGLKQQIGAGVTKRTLDGRTPQDQIVECTAIIRELEEEKRRIFLSLIIELKKHDIRIFNYQELNRRDQKALREFYIKNIFPLVTPLAMDPAHPFPFISNLSLNLLVTMEDLDKHSPMLARVKVPIGNNVPRFLRVGSGFHFVPLEQVIAHNLDLLFPDMTVKTCEFFRVTRNSNTERDEERADDLLDMIESELRDRKFAPIVRLQCDARMSPIHRGMLAAELGLDEHQDVYDIDVMIGKRDLWEMALLDISDLRDPSHQPIDNVLLPENENIFHIIRESGPVLLHHPYESFTTSVERFVREASQDPKVLAIKMTLYRTSAGTRIIDYLVNAAINGKQVAVVIELKARFDEAANIGWASRLEEAGIHITYGVLGLKTHSKTTLVVRRDYDGLRRYAHVATGNYHAGTARLYADLGVLTCNPEVGHDLTELFNYLTSGCKPGREYRKILTAPNSMKPALLAKIEREIAGHAEDNPGLIRLKTNALEDREIIESLYRASQAGVKVELIVRDTCCIRPGIPGLSENITVTSIVGRFLEHSRIYYFRNGGNEEFYIGSADLMRRNLQNRVEVIIPIEPPELQNELRNVLELQLTDRRNAWEMQPDNTYVQRSPAEGETPIGCQEQLILMAEERLREFRRLRKRRLKAIARRPSSQ